MEYKSSSHNKHLLNYHVVWCTKFRYKVLNNNIQLHLKQLITRICVKYEYEILEIEIMEEHTHLFLSLKPKIPVSEAVRTIKSITTKNIFSSFPALKKFYSRCGSLWSPGYFVTSVGNASNETIRSYILNQK